MAYIVRFTLLIISIISLQHIVSLALPEKKSYIIYLGTHQHDLQTPQHDLEVVTQSHYDILGSVLGSNEKAKESLQYSYKKYVNGFAARLTEDEIERIKSSSNVVSVVESRRLELQTTRSWEFLGLEQNGVTPKDSLWKLSNYGDNVILGTLDSGVWPESESFNDKELGPIPSKWKGTCMTGSDRTFKCNKKLIGARYFHEGYESSTSDSDISPRDNGGHGTHTLSTVGGSFVKGANVFGYGTGIAKGGSPKARVASYKVCWEGCSDADILAGFESATSDGVDVLSFSIAGAPLEYKTDSVAIASFHAMRNGISVVAAASNFGPIPGSVSNVAPWIFTVGASTSDRQFINRIHLGNTNITVKGATISPDRLLPKRKYFPLINASSAPSKSSESSRYCEEGTLNPSIVKGKIVICEVGGTNGELEIQKSLTVKTAGGVGMILVNDALAGDEIVASPHFLPTSHISYKEGLAISEYIKNTLKATALISNGKTEVSIKSSPVMASFSARGPNKCYPHLLKPDIIAPGVGVIAAYAGAVGASGLPEDTRKVKYNAMSGTSMSTPHVSGIVGLLKSLHPEWSPAAIRSALMTTATTTGNDNKTIQDSDGKPATPFAYGAGHINPNAAANPGLIYNLTENDYLDYLCSIGYTEKELKLFTNIPYSCKNPKSILDFNYPSITVTNFTTSAKLSRTVTNVGSPGTYEVKVMDLDEISVTVEPSKLTFNQVGEEHTFSVELKAVETMSKEQEKIKHVFGSLMWSDGTHNVRSPITVEKVPS